jgi:hypothetical protein
MDALFTIESLHMFHLEEMSGISMNPFSALAFSSHWAHYFFFSHRLSKMA